MTYRWIKILLIVLIAVASLFVFGRYYRNYNKEKSLLMGKWVNITTAAECASGFNELKVESHADKIFLDITVLSGTPCSNLDARWKRRGKVAHVDLRTVSNLPAGAGCIECVGAISGRLAIPRAGIRKVEVFRGEELIFEHKL